MSALDPILAAWVIPGVNPAYHRKAQERLRKEWPVLTDALDEAARRAPIEDAEPVAYEETCDDLREMALDCLSKAQGVATFDKDYALAELNHQAAQAWATLALVDALTPQPAKPIEVTDAIENAALDAMFPGADWAEFGMASEGYWRVKARAAIEAALKEMKR